MLLPNAGVRCSDKVWTFERQTAIKASIRIEDLEIEPHILPSSPLIIASVLIIPASLLAQSVDKQAEGKAQRLLGTFSLARSLSLVFVRGALCRE